MLSSCSFSCWTTYTPQLQVLPWAFGQSSTHQQQESSLQLHAKRQAQAALLSLGKAELNVSINFNTCVDCHEFFKSSSMMLDCRIQLRQPKTLDQWRLEARLSPAASTNTCQPLVEHHRYCHWVGGAGQNRSTHGQMQHST